jgi:bacterioferritin-associated ferredoxin
VLIGVGTGCGRCVEEFLRERRSEPSERNISKNQL